MKKEITEFILILGLFIIFPFLLTSSVAAVPTINIVPKSWVAHSESYTGPGTFSGAFTNEYDEDLSTYREWYVYHGGDGSVEGSLTGEFTWAKPMKIYQVYGKYQMANYAGNYMSSWMRFVTSLKINGV